MSKHFAVNYLIWYLIKVVLDSIFTLFIKLQQNGCCCQDLRGASFFFRHSNI